MMRFHHLPVLPHQSTKNSPFNAVLGNLNSHTWTVENAAGLRIKMNHHLWYCSPLNLHAECKLQIWSKSFWKIGVWLLSSWFWKDGDTSVKSAKYMDCQSGIGQGEQRLNLVGKIYWWRRQTYPHSLYQIRWTRLIDLLAQGGWIYWWRRRY